MFANLFIRKCLPAVLLAAGLALAGAAPRAMAADAPDNAIWLSLKKDVFGDRDIAEAKDMVQMEAPIRAEDAAIVPITIKMPADFAANVKTLTLFVDKNPVPVAAKFTFGAAAGTGERVISTRIRMDQYSDVRAIAETSDFARS